MHPKYDFSGRRALVTGSASGIGLATVTRLAEAGCRVALNYLPGDERGEAAVAHLRGAGRDVTGFPAAIGEGKEAALVEAVTSHLGGLDLLVNNAGTPGTRLAIPASSLELITDELWDAVLKTNLLGTFKVTQAAAPFLRDASGAIVNLASVSALTSRGSSLAYASSKAGVVALTRHLAQGLAPQVRVNAVAPGAVDTSWQIEWTEEHRKASLKSTPMGRRCTSEEIAETIVYLGFVAPMITGQTIIIDGGMTL